MILPKPEKNAQQRSEELWTLAKQRLEERAAHRIQSHEALREELQVRRAIAERLFPLPGGSTTEFDADPMPEVSEQSEAPIATKQSSIAPPPVGMVPEMTTDEFEEFV